MTIAACASAPPETTPSAATREKAVAILRAGLQGTGEADFWPAMHAAEGLTLAGYGHEVRTALEPRLNAERDARKRCGLAREIIRTGDVSKVASLAAILGSPDPYGHVHAAESLFKVGEVGDVATERAFAQQENGKLRLMAAAALGRCGTAKPRAVIREALLGDDADGVMLAAWILGQIGDKTDIEPLRSRLADAATPLGRASVEHALAALGDPEGLAALARNLTSKDDAIRAAAANMAGEAGAVATVPTLVKLLDDRVPDVRIRAAQSLLMLARARQGARRLTLDKKYTGVYALETLTLRDEPCRLKASANCSASSRSSRFVS
ncbi:MAG: HEAT repeat domain-containing protein [Planctomycetia bacterium]